MNAKAGRGSDQFIVRLPDGMRERIKAEAEANNRSMNAEIVARLEASFKPIEGAAHSEMLSVINKKLEDIFKRIDHGLR